MTEKRNPKSGRYEKGHTPPKSPGRPRKGLLERTAYRKAVDIVEGMLSKSHAVLDEHLSQTREVAVINPMTGAPEVDENGVIKTEMVGGDPRVAMWVIERMIPKDDSGLPKDMEVSLSEMSGVVAAAQTAVEWVACRQLTIEKGQKMLNLLLTYAQMRAFDHIGELRDLIKEFEAQSNHGAMSVPGDMVPQWGRLSDRIEANRALADATPMNTEPAE